MDAEEGGGRELREDALERWRGEEAILFFIYPQKDTWKTKICLDGLSKITWAKLSLKNVSKLNQYRHCLGMSPALQIC